jgi:hypothetical protein
MMRAIRRKAATVTHVTTDPALRDMRALSEASVGGVGGIF